MKGLNNNAQMLVLRGTVRLAHYLRNRAWNHHKVLAIRQEFNQHIADARYEEAWACCDKLYHIVQPNDDLVWEVRKMEQQILDMQEVAPLWV